MEEILASRSQMFSDIRVSKIAKLALLKTLQVLPPGTPYLIVDENFQAREWPPIHLRHRMRLQLQLFSEKRFDQHLDPLPIDAESARHFQSIAGRPPGSSRVALTTSELSKKAG